MSGQWTFWAISKTFEAVRWYGWMNGLLSYYELVSGRNRTFFNANTIIQLEREASKIHFSSFFGLNRPFRFNLYVSQIGTTSFTLTADMYDHRTGIKYASSDSKVVYVDAKTRRPVKLPEYILEGAKWSMKRLNIAIHNVQKLGLFDIPHEALYYDLKVLHSDCDRNLHANQSTYIRWCSDALYQHLSKHFNFTDSENNEGILIKEIAVQYIGEVLVNEEIIVCMWNIADRILFAILNGKRKQIFNAKLSVYDSSLLKIHRNQTIMTSSKL